jgi:regulation of enolase protein 1 (concanavalin A-like superfamily)
VTSAEPHLLGALGTASWTRTPSAWAPLAPDVVAWTCSPTSDFWHATGGIVGAHDGNALIGQPVQDDFEFQATVTGLLTKLYDQIGIFVLRDDWQWVKAGIELDETLWLSTVVTVAESDWSREPYAVPSVMLRVKRTNGTLRVFVAADDDWRMIRELTFDGAASFGVYSCSPRGAGFAALARLERIGQR